MKSNDFYYLIIAIDNFCFFPKTEFEKILIPVFSRNIFELEYCAKKQIWSKKDKLNLNLKYRFQLKNSLTVNNNLTY